MRKQYRCRVVKGQGPALVVIRSDKPAGAHRAVGESDQAPAAVQALGRLPPRAQESRAVRFGRPRSRRASSQRRTVGVVQVLLDRREVHRHRKARAVTGLDQVPAASRMPGTSPPTVRRRPAGDQILLRLAERDDPLTRLNSRRGQPGQHHDRAAVVDEPHGLGHVVGAGQCLVAASASPSDWRP